MSSQQKSTSQISQSGNIRNLSIISHVDHGKTTLSDHLIASGGMLPMHLAGSLRALDFLPEEQKRGITIETSLATFLIKYEGKKYIVNLIDTPGHVDFSGKVAESLRLVDGGLIIVDAVEGIMAQTKTVLRQAIREKLILVLFINKIDRLITELELSMHAIQLKIQRIIDEIRNICGEYGLEKESIPNFSKGSVLIGSAKDGWAIDNQFAKEHGKLQQIVDIYNKDEIRVFPSNISLSSIIIHCLINQFPTPQEGQKRKFPELVSTQFSAEILKDLHLCDHTLSSYVLVGRLFRLNRIKLVASIVRVVSGTLQRGIKLKSSITNDIVRIMRIIEFHGRTTKDVSHLKAGLIGGIILSKPVFPGDILVPIDREAILLKNISYVQDPVVAISIEPMKIHEMAQLQTIIESIVQSTPGLEFESNPDTGELLAMGVGTLQLDILTSELLNLNFDIEVSDPIILQFEMPQKNISFISEKYSNLRVIAGITNTFEEFESKLIHYDDSHFNQLIIKSNISTEARKGLIEVFRQSMRISPLSNIRIKEFTMIVQTYPDDKKSNSYESGMIIASSILRQALILTKSTPHQPYYTIEINLNETYLGNTIQELKKHKAIIESISTENECKITAIIPVKKGLKLADVLRQVTDGNVFWSFPSVNFLPENNYKKTR